MFYLKLYISKCQVGNESPPVDVTTKCMLDVILRRILNASNKTDVFETKDFYKKSFPGEKVHPKDMEG